MTTFREWLRTEGRAADPPALTDYVATLIRTEGWRTEFKAATSDVNFGVREAVCALANARGGEVFVGVTDAGAVEGTPVTEQKLNETLRQAEAERGDWFETDLMTVSDVLAVPFTSGKLCAYVIEVRGPDLPVMTFENGKYQMASRSGSDTIALDSRTSIRWFRERRRGDILRGAHAELSQYATQLSLFRPLPQGLPDQLPFITSASQDGTFYRYLTDEDRTFIVGRGAPGGGRYSGVVDIYYDVTRWCRAALATRPIHSRNLTLRDLDVANGGFANMDHDIAAGLARFADYIRSKGFRVPSA